MPSWRWWAGRTRWQMPQRGGELLWDYMSFPRCLWITLYMGTYTQGTSWYRARGDRLPQERWHWRTCATRWWWLWGHQGHPCAWFCWMLALSHGSQTGTFATSAPFSRPWYTARWVSRIRPVRTVLAEPVFRITLPVHRPQGEKVAELILTHAKASECTDVPRFKQEMAALVNEALSHTLSLGKVLLCSFSFYPQNTCGSQLISLLI